MKIGFIGCGNMATAMLKGILKSGEVEASDMIASAKSDKTREKIEKELGIRKADKSNCTGTCPITRSSARIPRLLIGQGQ